MDKKIKNSLLKNWKEIGHYKTPEKYEIEINLYKKMLNYFQVGESCYFMFCPPTLTVEFISDSVTKMLGYESNEFNIEKLVEIIHPDDLPYFADFELAVVNFKMNLPPDKIMKYKTRYNYRYRKKNGEYIHVLQQSITIQTDGEGSALRNLIIHTDISHLKSDNKMNLSFIGLDGEPSFINYQPKSRFVSSQNIFTKREIEILSLLSQGQSTLEISNTLKISPQTVSTHRKNIHKKANTNSTIELVSKALGNGWL